MKKTFLLIPLLTVFLIFFSACNAQEIGTLKSIANPYIAEYECTEAHLGEEDLLEKLDYINIVFVDKSTMQIIYKPKDSNKRIIESAYTLDSETKKLSAEVGVLGYKIKADTVIENGKFTITKEIGRKQLIMKFRVK